MVRKIKNILNKIKKTIANEEKYMDMLRKDGVTIGYGCSIDKTAIFGTEPYLIKLGNNVRITHGVEFITHDGSLWTLRKNGMLENADIFGQITVGNNTNIGWNVVIMPGVSIGNNCIVGCGAIVTNNISDNSVAIGIPARVVETIDEYYEKNKDRFVYTKNFSAVEKKKFLIEKFSIKSNL